MNRIYFREEQRYTQWWVWLLLLLIFAVSVLPLWYGVYVQVVEQREWGDQPMTTDKLIVVSVLMTIFVSAIIWLFAVQKLETEVTSEAFRFRFLPFIRKWRVIKPNEVAEYKIGPYNPVSTYGGWGIRSVGKSNGKAYTISGKTGLLITLTSGSKILIGTQRKDALKYAMEKMLNQ